MSKYRVRTTNFGKVTIHPFFHSFEPGGKPELQSFFDMQTGDPDASFTIPGQQSIELDDSYPHHAHNLKLLRTGFPTVVLEEVGEIRKADLEKEERVLELKQIVREASDNVRAIVAARLMPDTAGKLTDAEIKSSLYAMCEHATDKIEPLLRDTGIIRLNALRLELEKNHVIIKSGEYFKIGFAVQHEKLAKGSNIGSTDKQLIDFIGANEGWLNEAMADMVNRKVEKLAEPENDEGKTVVEEKEDREKVVKALVTKVSKRNHESFKFTDGQWVFNNSPLGKTPADVVSALVKNDTLYADFIAFTETVK